MRCLCALRLLLLILCTTTAVIAQSTDATISGLVLDPSGRVIPNADIEILNESTGVLYSGKTNETGIYTVSLLPPGQYRLQVSKVGFKSLIKPDIILNVQSAVALNFTLPIGATSETVTVGAGASLINTTDASVSTVIDSKFVENMPLNGRSFQDLISMTPGVATQSPQNSAQAIGYSGDFSVNGQRTESNLYLVDGVSANTNPGTGNGGPQSGTGGTLAASSALGTTQNLMSVDDLQEFRVEGSTYAAEYGRTPGGQFSFVTRSGTDAFHGTASDYLRNNFFDANNWFNDHYGTPISPLRQDDFALTFGGPIPRPKLHGGKGKTFFFISYEGLRLTQPQAAFLQYVPSDSLRQSSPGSIQSILKAFPVPTGPELQVPCSAVTVTCPDGVATGTLVQSGLSPFILPYSLPGQIDSTSVRADHVVSPKLSVFFRFATTPSSTQSRQYVEVLSHASNTNNFTLGLTSQLTSQQDNEFRLGYTASSAALTSQSDSFGGATPIDLNTAMGVGGYPSGASSSFEIYISSVGGSEIIDANSKNQQSQWNLVDDYSLSFGHHHVKIGANYLRIIAPLNPGSPFSAAWFYSPQSVEANTATYLEPSVQVNSTPIFDEFAAYVEDEWKPLRNLSISYGLRWEMDPPPTEAHGDDAYTLEGNLSEPSTLTLAPRGTPLWKTTWYNLAPRLGLAWEVGDRAGFETVLRGGGGVFFDTDNQEAALGYEGLGFSAYSLYSAVPIPATSQQLNLAPTVIPPYTNGIVYAYAPHLQLPYTLEWNVSLQQALGRQQAVTMSYVGASGRRLVGEQQLSLFSINPNFNAVRYFQAGLNSSYDALQLQFQRTLSRELQAIASYTWSHSLDFGSTSVSLPLIRGNSDFDVRHNLQAGINWNLPALLPGKNVIAKAVSDDWGLDGRVIARTGYPVTLAGNTVTDPTTGSQYNGGVNYDSSKSIYLYGSQYPGGKAINGGPDAANPAFTAPVSGPVGDAPRNFVRGFGATEVNVAARRDFHLTDKLTLRFRAEAFNVLNHPIFGYIDPILSDGTFGQATETLNESLTTMASQYQQGGSRSMQFALKLVY